MCEGGGHPLSQHHLSLWRAEAGGHGASSARLPSPLPTPALLLPATHPQDAFPEAWERRGSRRGFQALRAHCCLPCSRHLSVRVVMVPPPAAHRMGCDSRARRSSRGGGARFSHGSSRKRIVQPGSPALPGAILVDRPESGPREGRAPPCRVGLASGRKGSARPRAGDAGSQTWGLHSWGLSSGIHTTSGNHITRSARPTF